MTFSARLATRQAAFGLLSAVVAQSAVWAATPARPAQPTKPALAAPAKPAPAPADDPKAIFADAQKAYQLGRFEEAIGKYEKVYEITNHPSLLFNIAQCHRQLSNYERAAFFYNRYLSAAEAPIPNEQMARDLLAEMTARNAEAERAKAEQARLAALAAEPKQPERPALLAPAPTGLSPRRIAGIGIGGAGVVAAAVGGGLIGGAWGLRDQAVAERDAMASQSLYQRANSQNGVGVGLIVAGAAVAVVGVVLFAIPDGASSTSTTVAVGPSGVTVAGRF